MKDVLLVGGMGSGKTTMAKALQREVPEMHYIYASHYAVRIPMTLLATTQPDLLEFSKRGYVNMILRNEDIELTTFSRQEMDEYGRRVIETYGESIFGEIPFCAKSSGAPNIIDNAPKTASVKYLKDRGFYVVGLHCSFGNQVKRRLQDRKDIDSEDKYVLEEQVRRTNEFFDVDGVLNMADVVFHTNRIRSDSKGVIKKVLKQIQ